MEVDAILIHSEEDKKGDERKLPEIGANRESVSIAKHVIPHIDAERQPTAMFGRLPLCVMRRATSAFGSPRSNDKQSQPVPNIQGGRGRSSDSTHKTDKSCGKPFLKTGKRHPNSFMFVEREDCADLADHLEEKKASESLEVAQGD